MIHCHTCRAHRTISSLNRRRKKRRKRFSRRNTQPMRLLRRYRTIPAATQGDCSLLVPCLCFSPDLTVLLAQSMTEEPLRRTSFIQGRTESSGRRTIFKCPRQNLFPQNTQTNSHANHPPTPAL